MMQKFMFLVNYGLKKKLKSKAFIISNIVLIVLLVAIINIDSIINYFGGDFNENVNIYVIDNTNESFDTFKTNYESINLNIFEGNSKDDNEKTNIVLISDKTIDILKEEIKDKSDVIVELKNDDDNYLSASVISDGYIDMLTYQGIVQSINNTKYSLALKNSNIDVNELNKISKAPVIERIILDEGKNTEEENMNTIMTVVFPTLILPFFMLILLLVQLIGGEINEEKTTRSMEVIISNVSAKVHLFSKLVTNNIFVILQAVLVFIYGAIGLFIRNITGGSDIITGEISNVLSIVSSSGLMDKLFYIVPITIILMILSFVAYSLLASVLASMTVNVEDYQQVQAPIIIICLIGYYLSVMAGMFEGSIFIKFLSYVPLISCLLSPALLIIGQIGIIDSFISIIVMCVFVYFLAKYGLRIYKIGILNYSTDKMWKKMFKAAKKS